jgi:adenylate cyclase
MTCRSIRFASFTLDLDRLCLRGPSGQAELRPKSYEVLRFLVEHAGRVVGKDEVMKAVWRDVTVTDESLVVCVSEVRRALGDTNQQIVKTVPKRGYLLDVPISRSDVIGRPITPTVEPFLQPATLPDQPSIAVLPFSNLSQDPGQEYFADGMVEDIITELSRFRGLFVIARNSSFQWKGKPVDVRQVGLELGVRYVLEGSVRKAGDRIRVSAQLIDAENGGHLWAEKYDNDSGNIFGLQDGLTASVVSAIQPEILVREGHRAARKNPSNLDAFDCCMRGMWHSHQLTADDNRLAESWLRRSIELDTRLARAHVWLARVLAARCWSGNSSDIERELQESQTSAERALALDDCDAECHYALSILCLMAKEHERALAAAQQAINLNPNFAFGYFALGETRIFMGRFAEGLDPIVRCLRLSPRDPLASFFVSLVALAHYHLGNYDEAVRWSERALQRRRTYVVLRTMAATLGQLGKTEEARSILVEMERIKPINMKRHWELTNPYSDPSHEAHLLDGLSRAGLAEH